MEIDILFEDNHCLAVNKPTGIQTQGVPGGTLSLETRVRDYLREKYNKRGRVYLGIPHRLDRPVSGVILFAKQTKSAQRLAEQFNNRQVTKIYWALVEGKIVPENGEWIDWIRKIKNEARVEITKKDVEGAKEAKLNYRCLQYQNGNSLLEIDLITGRMHQIRVQASSRGFPILGDKLYGGKPPLQNHEIALHARSLQFLHPVRFEPITVTAPLPDFWEEFSLSGSPQSDYFDYKF